MKGQTIFQLLTLLQEETDEQHKLSQQAISDRMLARFGVKVNRRTLKGYLDELIEAGFPLSTSKKTRTLPDGTTEVLQTDWYMEPRFELSELRLITDLLTAMPAVPKSQKDALIEKLMMHTSPINRQAHPTQKLVYLDTPPAQQLLYSVDILLEAIRRNKMVKFLYCSYQLDGNNQPVLVPRKSSDGADREYLVSPYEIAVAHGRYYLMCCKEPYRSVAHYRIDRITEIEIKDDFERLPLDQLNTAHTLPENLAEQLYMYSGDTITCEFLADARILGDILDWFGTAAQISRTEHPAELLVRVHVHPKAMQHWALQYGEWVTVLSPDTFCAELSEVIGSLARRYATPPAPIRKS